MNNLPNKLTMLRIWMVPVFLLFFVPLPFLDGTGFAQFQADDGKLFAAIVFILASITDWLDGYIARKTGQVTSMGKFLDPVADKLLVTSAVIGLVFAGSVSPWSAVIIVGRDVMLSALRMLGATGGRVISADIWGKIKTAVQMIAIIVLLLQHRVLPFTANWKITPGNALMGAAVLLTIYSGIDYLLKNKELLKQ